MDIRTDARIPFDRASVFETYRDRLVELVTFLPDVRSIEVKERRENGDTVEVFNVWRGGGEIPAVARAFLNESMLSWDDLATWNNAAWTCAWRVRTHAFTEAVTCEGTNTFVAEGSNTVLQIRGSLRIDGSKLAGVPRLMAGTVSRAVEDVLVKKITPNLVQVSDGVRRYLTAKR